DPRVAPPAVLGLLLLVAGPGVEREVAPAGPLDPGAALAHPRRQALLPQLRRLDHVVVDADDLREPGHDLFLLGQRVVLMTRVDPTVLAHERGRPPADAPAGGGAHVLVVVPTESHRVRLLVDEQEVLDAAGAVAVDLDDG